MVLHKFSIGKWEIWIILYNRLLELGSGQKSGPFSKSSYHKVPWKVWPLNSIKTRLSFCGMSAISFKICGEKLRKKLRKKQERKWEEDVREFNLDPDFSHCCRKTQTTLAQKRTKRLSKLSFRQQRTVGDFPVRSDKT